ncbi:hypothetical protein MTO96_023807 [Rhipicephalus appendiculatus]
MDRERPRGVWFRYGIKRKARRQGGRERHRFIGLSAAAAREHIIALLPRSERKGRPQPRQAGPIKARGDERAPFLMYGWRRCSCPRERGGEASSSLMKTEGVISAKAWLAARGARDEGVKKKKRCSSTALELAKCRRYTCLPLDGV